MKGLELNRAFFFEWGLPLIEREMPNLKDHVAAGSFEGSQTLGADDHLSRDHGWGPCFELMISEDMGIPLREVAEHLRRLAPREFKGYVFRGKPDRMIRVWGIAEFFERLFGCIPNNDYDWVKRSSQLDIVESSLYFLRYGSLFFDGNGRFSELRNRFSQYPDDVRLLRMRESAWRINHYGRYNFCQRLVERDDRITMQIALGYFSEAIMKMYFYLESDFAPYWKWLSFEFRRRQLSLTTERALKTLPELEPTDQATCIHTICEELKNKILSSDLITTRVKNSSSNQWFSLLAEALKQEIMDQRIKKMS